MRLVWIMHE
jgi:hypothetical protein